MTKTQEELTQLKQEYESLNNKLKELSEDELKLVTGGLYVPKQEECIQQQEKLAQKDTYVPQLDNNIQQPITPHISHFKRQQYVNNSKTIFRCKVCGDINFDWDAILNHVKNAHNSDSNMIETIDFS